MDGTNKTQIAAVRFEEWETGGEYVNFCLNIKGYNNELYFRSNFVSNIYKVNIDNGLCEAVVFLADSNEELLGSDFYLKDGFLYYAKEYDVFEDSVGKKRSVLCKKEILTGVEKEIYSVDSVNFLEFEVRGDNIYIWNSFGKYIKMDTNGNNIETDDLKVLKNMIYNGKNYSLLRRKTLGNEIFEYLSEQKFDFSYFNIKDDTIYLVGIENNWGNAIYKASEDGESFVKITDGDYISDINIVGDWIFYINIDNNKIYMVKIDGSQKSEISD